MSTPDKKLSLGVATASLLSQILSREQYSIPLISAAADSCLRSQGLFQEGDIRVDQNLQGTGESFQGFKGRHSVTAFDARDVATQQAGTFLDVALRKLFVLAEVREAVANYQGSGFLR